MTEAEAERLLDLAQAELGGMGAGYRRHVINVYRETIGFDDGQLALENPAPIEAEPELPGTFVRGPVESIGLQPAEHEHQAPKVRTSDPDPSREAALQNAPRRSSQRGRILELLCIIPSGRGYLAEELSEQTGIPLNALSTRMSELVKGGWANTHGLKRETKHGVVATTYQATMKARLHFREQADEALRAA
jgi:hypothetical protein